MYNRYLTGEADYQPVEAPQSDERRRVETQPAESRQRRESMGALSGLQNILKGDLVGRLGFDRLDTGDLLTILVLLVILSEGQDSTEMVITLGLLLAMGFFDQEDQTV